MVHEKNILRKNYEKTDHHIKKSYEQQVHTNKKIMFCLPCVPSFDKKGEVSKFNLNRLEVIV